MTRFLRLLPKSVCTLVAACLAVAMIANDSSAVDVRPYEARVVASGASVQSGPGEQFYPTDTLAEGDLVEVYQEKPGGWLGIRPTANSFSWVRKSELEVRSDGVAEILHDGVASRIGSRMSDKHNAAQIRLRKGELVEVLGEERIENETWYKIAPPAGEFRWIQAALVERRGPIQTVAAESTSPSTGVGQTSKNEPPTSGQPNGPASTAQGDALAAPPLMPNTADSANSPNQTWKATGASDRGNTSPETGRYESQPTSQGSSAVPADANSMPPTSPPPIPAAQQAAPPAEGSPAPPLRATAAANSPSAPVAGNRSLSEELASVEIRLSRMASAPVHLWNTERLERDTAQLLNRARTQAERDAALATMAKIGQFTSIARRSNTLPTANANAILAQQTQLPSAAAAGNVAAPGGPYDSVGILRPVVSRRPGAPQFALVDDRGQVLTFLTPTPDVNLQPYLGRRVGVVGNRGYIAEFNRAHVTAARITPLVR
ncbi:MAG: SH3 domain-containing protein [Pirellulales bacterium]|nr:SH3 domain-containing protein [Pirellulales bacterium]